MNFQNWLYEQRKSAAEQAAHILSLKSLVIWDLETVGLTAGSQIVQFAACDRTGKILLETYVNPVQPIPAAATAIHGIEDHEVITKPILIEILPKIRKALNGKVWCIYNSQFDFQSILGNLLNRYLSIHYIQPQLKHNLQYSLPELQIYDLMQLYSAFYGDWSEQESSFTLQKLDTACEQQDISIEIPANSALGSCLRSLALLRHMEAWHNDQRGIIKKRRGKKNG